MSPAFEGGFLTIGSPGKSPEVRYFEDSPESTTVPSPVAGTQ